MLTTKERLFLLFDGKAEFADEFSEFEIFSVRVSEELSVAQREASCFGVEESIVGAHIDNFGDEHIVRSEVSYLLNFTFDAQWGLFNSR